MGYFLKAENLKDKTKKQLTAKDVSNTNSKNQQMVGTLETKDISKNCSKHLTSQVFHNMPLKITNIMFFFSVKSCTYKLSYHLNTPLFYLILMSNKLYSWCISFQSGNISFFALPVYHQLNLKAWVTFQLISLENCVGFVTLIHSPNTILE